MDVSQYLEIFIDETKEHLQSLNEHILVIEKEPENVDTINEIFRAAHSLKGMAGTMGFKRMQRLTHDMENVFSEVRNGKMTVTADLVDTLFKCLDALEEYLTNIQETAEEGTEDNEEIIAALNKAVEVGTGEQPAEKTETKQEKSEAKASSDGEKDEENRKYKQLVLADFEKHAVQEAKEKGMHIFGITVFIQETCLLKAARAFLVFKALEEMGEIIKSVPAVQDIEDEKFEFDFSVIYITKEDIEKVKAAILNVSEIQSAFMEELTV